MKVWHVIVGYIVLAIMCVFLMSYGLNGLIKDGGLKRIVDTVWYGEKGEK